MKKILILITSIILVFVFYWAIRCTYGFSQIVELPNKFSGSFYSREEYEKLFCESGLEATFFVVLFFLFLNILLILLYKGTFSEISKKIYRFKEQISCSCFLLTMCFVLMICPYEAMGMFVFYISGITIPLAIIMVVINIVGLIKDKRRC